jgi:hypothetical protein
MRFIIFVTAIALRVPIRHSVAAAFVAPLAVFSCNAFA